MNATQDQLKKDVKLPSPPAIAVRILEAVRREETSFAELARIISSDPALAARILRIANSSFYALPAKIDNIEKALTFLGVDVVKNIALSFVVSRSLRGPSGQGFDFDGFWRRSVTAAVAAQLVAELVGQRNDEVFAAALLMDIGQVIMYLSRGEAFGQVQEERFLSEGDREKAETRVFGITHQALGAKVLKSWGLPESLYLPVCHHHSAERAPQTQQGSALLLQVADLAAAVYHGSGSGEKICEIGTILRDRLQVPQGAVEEFIDHVAEKSVEILSSFEIDPGNLKPFSQLMQEANEELGKLNLSYEQLVMELKEAKEKAERLFGELQEANEKLRELAFRDGLTGLYNHRYFQDVMDKEVARAERYDRPLSLILFDIDFFKKINDSYGHPFGDIVLKQISRSVEMLVRKSDVVARYGGEEFAVVLPETGLKGAYVLAERLREGVAGLQICADGITARVTVSAGLTTFNPRQSTDEKAKIVEAADQALYQAKENGRNRVCVAAERVRAAG